LATTATAFTADTLPGSDPLVVTFRAFAYVVVGAAIGLFALIAVLFFVVLWRGAEIDAAAERQVRFRNLTALARRIGRKGGLQGAVAAAAAAGGGGGPKA
jgi:hypothetical protein